MIQFFPSLVGKLKTDPNAIAFFNATGITNSTQKDAVNYLVVELKKANIWNKMKAVYPFVGGTATTHKFNLKDSRDLDVAFRITFNGSLTHDNDGALSTGGYGNTNILRQNDLPLANVHYSFYCINNPDPTFTGTNFNNDHFTSAIGLADTSHRMNLSPRRTFGGLQNRAISDFSNTSAVGAAIIANNTDAKGFYVASRLSATDNTIYKNNNILIQNTTNWNVASTSNLPIFIFNQNTSSGTPFVQSSIHKGSFASIGEGLTSTEALDLYNIVQQYQTILGRQV